jgi:tetratricopeptide (TPR) repeat protein
MYKIILSVTFSWFFCLVALSQNAILDKVDNLIWNTQFKEAINLIDQSLANNPSQEIGVKLLNKKADALIRIGKLQEASQLLKKIEDGLSDSKQDQILKAITKSNQGFLQLNIGRTDLAEEELSEAMNLFEKSGKPESLEAAQALSHLGLVYVNTGKYTQAEEQMQQALLLRQKQLKDTHELIAATYNDLGLVYSQTDNDKSLDYYEKAL